MDALAIKNLWKRLSIDFVFTAPPTEPTRRSLIIKSRRLAELLEARDHEAEMTPRQRAVWQREIESTVALLWRTDTVQRVRLQPMDEIKMGLYYFEEILYNAVADLYSELAQFLTEHYPHDQWSVPSFLRLGSWIGGDQDGNPHVGPETLFQALRLQRARVIEQYRSSIEALAQEYSQPLQHCSITGALQQSIAYYARFMPQPYHT